MSKRVKITNRSSETVVYKIDEMNGLQRRFSPNEEKEVDEDEIKKLSYLPGGKYLLENYFKIDDVNVVKEIVGDVEMEYNYSTEDVKKLLLDGSLDELLDCLDFAPEGVKDLIKTLSVELPLNDVSKREAILEKLGFNVDNAIRIKKEIAEPVQETSVSKRRVKPQQTTATTQKYRRVAK